MLNIKDYQETFPITFDFTQTLETETIASINLAVTDSTGVDTNPASVLFTAATYSLGIVTQWFTGGLIDSVYHVRCKVTTSGGRVLVLSQDIQVIKK